jgi:hypothetical protein
MDNGRANGLNLQHTSSLAKLLLSGYYSLNGGKIAQGQG